MGIFTALPQSLGTLFASAFALSTDTPDADDRIIHNQATGELFYDADRSCGSLQVKFAAVSPGLVLTRADFMVV